MPQLLQDLPSSALQQAIKASREEVLKQLYQEEYPKTERFVREKGGTLEQAKDIFQEAFIAMWRNVQLGKMQVESRSALGAYLYRIAQNKWIDYLRSGYHKNTVLTEAPTEVASPSEDSHQHLEAVQTAYRQLGESCRELLQRFYYQNETVQAIAEAMDWTEATVRNNKYRCMERLRNMIKKTKN